MSKNVFKEHKPGSVDAAPLPPYQFDTLEELLQQPQVKRFATSKDHIEFQLSKPYRKGGIYHLMQVCKDGSYWVVGYLKQSVAGLKEWEKPE